MNDELIKELFRCQSWIQDALDKGDDTHDFVHIVDGIMEQRFQFWPHADCCVITEIIDYPKKRVIHVFLAGGDFASIIQLEPNIIEWAKSIGCTDVSLSGRKGWLRRLKQYGWLDANQHHMIKRI